MNFKKGDALPTVYISHELAQETAQLLDSFARSRPSEGVVYWFGIENGVIAVVTTMIMPNADTSGGTVQTSAKANADVINAIVGTPLMLLGQAHSHPGWNVTHSLVDDMETFAQFEGALSIVVPWFGRYGLDLKECGVYRYIGGRYRHLDDLDSHLRIVPGFVDLRRTITGVSNVA